MSTLALEEPKVTLSQRSDNTSDTREKKNLARVLSLMTRQIFRLRALLPSKQAVCGRPPLV